MPKLNSGASHDTEPHVFNPEGEEYPSWRRAEGAFGGGMSAAENRLQNSRCRIPYDSGSPKATAAGKDTGRDATNVLAKPGRNPEPASPTSEKQSRDR